MQNILALICARKGSKGVKGKNVRGFLGYPISYYTLSAYDLFLKRYPKEDTSFTLAVNTDSEELVKQLGLTTVPHHIIERKESLAGDRVSKIDVIRDSLNISETRLNLQFDLVIDLDVTSPLRKAVDIDNIIKAITSSLEADIALSVTDARRNPYFNQLTENEDGFLTTVVKSNFIARQQAPEVFDANASLYAYRPGYLKNSDGIFLNAKLVHSLMEDTAILDIDSEKDFQLMEAVAKYLYETDVSYGEIRENIKEIMK